jgi:hypothetical protein
MHTYRQTGPAEWTVGFERQGVYDRWRSIMVFPTEAEAAAYVAFLNGGTQVAGRSAPRDAEPEPKTT